MATFKRVHNSGTVEILNEHGDGWHIRFELREVNQLPTTIVGFCAPTLEKAKQLADRELLRCGHVCNETCQSWVQF